MHTEKRCSKCGEIKPLSAFRFHPLGKFKTQAKCQDCENAYSRQRNKENRPAVKAAEDRYIAKHPEIHGIKYQRRKQKPGYMQAQTVHGERWRQNNKEWFNQYWRMRRATDPAHKATTNLRSRVTKVIRTGDRSDSLEQLLDCTIDQFLGHLEINFQEGMTWENYGEWHVDHKRPCASFDLSDQRQQRECFNWKNLQPLWAVDNLKKGAKILNG